MWKAEDIVTSRQSESAYARKRGRQLLLSFDQLLASRQNELTHDWTPSLLLVLYCMTACAYKNESLCLSGAVPAHVHSLQIWAPRSIAETTRLVVAIPLAAVLGWQRSNSATSALDVKHRRQKAAGFSYYNSVLYSTAPAPHESILVPMIGIAIIRNQLNPIRNFYLHLTVASNSLKFELHHLSSQFPIASSRNLRTEPDRFSFALFCAKRVAEWTVGCHTPYYSR